MPKNNAMSTRLPSVAQACGIALALAVAAGHATAAIYKWVDEKGITQYSEKPPQGKKPAEVPIRAQPSAPQGAQNVPKTWQQQEAEFQQRRVEQEERRLKNEALGQAGADARMRTCLQARQDLHTLEQQRPVYWVNDKGERVYLEDKNRDQLRERLRAIAEQNCDRR